MERETKQLITKHGTEVVLKGYLTGGELRRIQGVLLQGADIEAAGEGGLKGVKGEAVAAYEVKLAETAIVSIGGKTTDIMATLDELRADEYMEIMEAVRLMATDFFGKPSK